MSFRTKIRNITITTRDSNEWSEYEVVTATFNQPIVFASAALHRFDLEYTDGTFKVKDVGVQIKAADLESNNDYANRDYSVSVPVRYRLSASKRHDTQAKIGVLFTAEEAEVVYVGWDPDKNEGNGRLTTNSVHADGSCKILWVCEDGIAITRIFGRAEAVFGKPVQSDPNSPQSNWVAWDTGLTGAYEYSICAIPPGGKREVCIDPQVVNEPQNP